MGNGADPDGRTTGTRALPIYSMAFRGVKFTRFLGEMQNFFDRGRRSGEPSSAVRGPGGRGEVKTGAVSVLAEGVRGLAPRASDYSTPDRSRYTESKNGLRPRMSVVVNCFKSRRREVCIHLRRGKRLMTQQLLNTAEVRPAVEHMRSEAVP